MTNSNDVVMKDYREMTKALIKKREELSKELQGSFQIMIKDFLDKNPEIAYVTWAQYTPYHNDGDECTFSVNERHYPLVALIGEEQPVGYEAESYELNDYYKNNQSEAGITDKRAAELMDAINEIETILNEIPQELYKDVFGDHVSVMISRDGVTTEEHDHE